MKELLRSILCFSLLCLGCHVYCQDDCINAEDLGQITDYCSGSLEFSTAIATQSDDPIPACWNPSGGDEVKDVWFSFKTTNIAVSIKVFGRDAQLNPGGLEGPGIEIYQTPCQDLQLVDCTVTKTNNDRDIILDDIVIGQTYFIRVASTVGVDGTFQLCINNFAPPQDEESDCGDGVVLCDKSPFEIEFLEGFGLIPNEADNSCLDNGGFNSEVNSAWYLWTCDRPGTLEFDLIPINPNDAEEDLDFVVYRLPSGLSDCENREPIRCMASGANTDGSGNVDASSSAPCFGQTGLSEDADDFEESAGCQSGNDNYVAALDMVRGETYGLLINNFSGNFGSTFGFKIEFGGSGTFLGPSIELSIASVGNFLECDKEITFDEMIVQGDGVISYEWNFGVGANPQRSSLSGQQPVIYSSFGEKLTALTVENENGCRVTEIIDFYVDPCCDDTAADLDITGIPTDILCAGDATGIIELVGSGGDPYYEYSTDDVNYGPNTVIDELPAGNYDLFIQDIKGCKASSSVTITEAESFDVNAGPDQTIALGDSTTLFGRIQPESGNYETIWTPVEAVDCSSCLDIDVTPLGTTEYILSLVSSNNCMAQDTVIVFTETTRPIFQPNIITTKDDILNNYFKLFGDQAAVGLDDLYIYDKWGSLVYEGHDLPIGDVPGQGWDGMLNGRPVMNGVYVYKARVSFLDGVVIDYFGDITVVD